MDTLVALFDMDGTIADYHAQMRRDLATLDACGNVPELLHCYLPAWLEARKDIVGSQPGWWRNLPAIESGLGIMKLCTEIGFGIHVLTQGPKSKPLAWGEKLEWCEKHVKPIDVDYGITVTRNGKGLHYGRVFVDDWPPFMQAWLEHRPRGLGLMPITPENKGFNHPQVVKYDLNNWRSDELVDKLHRAYSRKSREFA